jgi:DNA-binding NtrC family response regulator
MIPSASGLHEAPQTPREWPYLASEKPSPQKLSILLATTDLEIRSSLTELLQDYRVTTLSASSTEEIKSALAREDVAACFCGFWLIDGTYRDVVRHLKRARPEIPVIIVCAPTCPNEYRDYLAALNIRAFDFICHPYRRSDLERILHSAMALRNRPAEMPAPAVDCPDSSLSSPELRRAS